MDGPREERQPCIARRIGRKCEAPAPPPKLGCGPQARRPALAARSRQIDRIRTSHYRRNPPMSPGRNLMQKLRIGLSSLALAMLAAAPAQAQGTIKIGLIMTYSGQFADVATMMDTGIKLYMQQHGDTVAGKK